jgi:hypothetical protein
LKENTDLLIKIKEVRYLLNGMTKTGHKAKYASKFKNLRYAIILLASLVLPIFEDNTKKIQNSTFINYYNGRRGKRTVFDCRRRRHRSHQHGRRDLGVEHTVGSHDRHRHFAADLDGYTRSDAERRGQRAKPAMD